MPTDYDLLSELAKDASLQSLITALGAIAIDPTANTVQARLKSILAAVETLTSTTTTVGTAGTTNASANKDALVAALGALRDALKGAGNKDFTTVQTTLDAFKAEAKSESDATQALLTANEAARDADATTLQARADLLATEHSQRRVIAPEEVGDPYLDDGTLSGYSVTNNTGTVLFGATIGIVQDAACPRGKNVIEVRQGTAAATARCSLFPPFAPRCVAGDNVTMSLHRRAISNATGACALNFYDINGNYISGVGTPMESFGAGWTGRVLSAIAPDGASYVFAGVSTEPITSYTGPVARYSGFSVRILHEPASLGQKTSAQSFATVLSSEQEAKVDLLTKEATLALRNNAFATLLHYQPDTTGKELRADETSTDRYHGRAPDGTATNAAAWEVVRFYKDASDNIIRTRYRTGVVWDTRAVGWS